MTASPVSSPAGNSEAGSAVVEFTLVVALLTVLTMAVLQLALALHVRNTLLDAASEGARYGALADRTAEDGAGRTRDLITIAISDSYAEDVEATAGDYRGHAALVITVTAPLPLAGLLGPGRGIEVVGHAAIEAAR